jgi:hypothetical protein
MRYLFLLLTHAAILALFYRVKVAPYKEQLDEKHKGWFNAVDGVIESVTKMLGGGSKPYVLGQNLTWNIGELILLVALLGVSIFLAAFR